MTVMRNIKHPDGSINVTKNVNIVVSPYCETFFDNIEEYVQEPVRVLIDLGYLTICSCDGFHKFNYDAHVVVVVNSREYAQNLIKYLKEQLGLYSVLDNTFDHLGVDVINKTFLRQYTEYFCVKILLYDANFLFAPWKKNIIKKNTSLLKTLPAFLA